MIPKYQTRKAKYLKKNSLKYKKDRAWGRVKHIIVKKWLNYAKSLLISNNRFYVFNSWELISFQVGKY